MKTNVKRTQEDKFIIGFVILLVTTMILSIIVVALCISMSVQDNEPKATVSANNTYVSPTSTKTNNITSNNTPATPSLEEQYASVFAWQKWYDDQDFGVEQLYYLNDCCEKYDIPMEFMLALIANESSFRSTAEANGSSATGYCQVIKSTAKWVYEDMLKRGEYDVDNHRTLMKNWRLNMDISTRLVYWLYNTYESWEMAAQRYYGSTDSSANAAYADRVDIRMMELFGCTIADLDARS